MDKIYLVTLYKQDEYGFTKEQAYKKLVFDASKVTRSFLKKLAVTLAKTANEKMHYPFVSTTYSEIELIKVTN